MSEQTFNHFSLASRLFGNLFYRSPTDPILANVFNWLQQQGLSQIWALDTDETSQTAIENVQMALKPDALTQEYQRLFIGESAKASPKLSDYQIDPLALQQFRQQLAMPEVENFDHFGLLLLTASWLEDNGDNLPNQNATQIELQRELFEQFLLPCAAKFLTKVESHANLPFYRSVATLTRELLAAMADELDESWQELG